MAARKGRRPVRSAPARRGPECSEIPGGRGEEEVVVLRRRRRREARSHGRAPLPGTLRAVAAAGAEPDPRGARCGRAEGHSPPPRALAAPGAAPSPPPLGLPPRAERGRMTELQSALLLRRQLAELNKNPVEGFSAGLIDDNDLYRWEVLIIGPPDTLYEGGVFKAHLTFPKDYPLRPPKMKFITEIWHPNVDKNGDVCISILHEPGEDKYGYEKPEERWLPIHTVETIMISVISMLADPNGDSPANVDAAKEWREDRNGEFKRKVARCVRKSQETAFE
ncbi:ubiquitin-conjugating enzyme E2 G1 [Pezoporus wallicus]|uniref:ubiquitin-conjugating enzyme E2 G1 n=1 Tax=Pezoporus wallicus TaxID=35540 RepID=UPI00254A6849|nr:ubiquitin-conjugating enzyme E2 G1 [Pezoporus wallicus]XP_061326361.1 ubiquitin-conjugating enzyme E2 G1 [Pezoporus flaviventris]